jgi:hypothetical protein
MSLIASASFKRHEKVRANVDLPGVPAGTTGKVLVVSGVTWIRCRVLFANGVEHGSLDARHLVTPKAFVPLNQRVPEEASETKSAADVGTADEGDAGAADNAFGVPAHLLERSKQARQRLTAA